MMNKPDIIYWKIQDQQIFVDLEWLSDSEFTRQQKFRFPKRKEEWLSGRRVAKNLLLITSKVLADCKLSDFSINNRENGSPYVSQNGIELPGSLSISHRSGYAAAAWTANPLYKIGIDLELIEPKPNSFVEDYFTPKEMKFVFQQDTDDQALASSLIWSAKEAVMKAIQTGLRIDTRQIEIEINPSESINGWDSLTLTKTPHDFDRGKLFWKQFGSIIITMAITTTSQDNKNLLPMNIIDILD